MKSLLLGICLALIACTAVSVTSAGFPPTENEVLMFQLDGMSQDMVGTDTISFDLVNYDFTACTHRQVSDVVYSATNMEIGCAELKLDTNYNLDVTELEQTTYKQRSGWMDLGAVNSIPIATGGDGDNIRTSRMFTHDSIAYLITTLEGLADKHQANEAKRELSIYPHPLLEHTISAGTCNDSAIILPDRNIV